MFLNLLEAATFCGYAPRTFRRLSKEYRIPKYGPTRSRFKQDDLVIFMEYPCHFLEQQEPLVRARRKPTPITGCSYR